MQSHQNMVFSTAMRLLANSAEAEDIAQDVFLKAFERFDQLRDNPAAGGWLRTTAINRSLNHLKRYRSRWTFFSELFRGADDAETPEPEFAASDSSETGLDALDRSDQVERALRKLPESQRVALTLYHIEELSYEDIASRLGVSLGKVKTDIFRGRESLRKKLRFVELEGNWSGS